MRKKYKFCSALASSCCLMATAICVGVGIFIGSNTNVGYTNAFALETQQYVIEEILGAPLGDVNEDTVKEVLNTLEEAANMVAKGKRNNKLPEVVLYEYDKYFGEWAEPCEDAKATVVSYITHLYGNGVFKVFFEVKSCGKVFEIQGSKSENTVILTGIERLFEEQRTVYDANNGDSGMVDDVDDVYIPTPTPTPIETPDELTGSDQDFYEDTGYTSQRSDETIGEVEDIVEE